MSGIAKSRMHWLDGARLAAAFCIIGIHSSSDHIGQAFAAALYSGVVVPTGCAHGQKGAAVLYQR